MLCYRQVNYLIPLPFTSLILSHPCTPSSALSLTPSSHHTLKHTGVVGRQGVPCFGHPPCHLFINSSAWVPAVIILTTPPHPSAHYSSVLRQRRAGWGSPRLTAQISPSSIPEWHQRARGLWENGGIWIERAPCTLSSVWHTGLNQEIFACGTWSLPFQMHSSYQQFTHLSLPFWNTQGPRGTNGPKE